MQTAHSDLSTGDCLDSVLCYCLCSYNRFLARFVWFRALQDCLEVRLKFLSGRDTIRGGRESCYGFTDFCLATPFLFFRKWLCTNYRAMFATISEPFFSLFPWRQHDMPTASKRGRETNPVSFPAPKCFLSSVYLFSSPLEPKETTKCHYFLSNFPTNNRRDCTFLSKQREILLKPELMHYIRIVLPIFYYFEVCFYIMTSLCCLGLTIAMTAAPAPARAQMNRWNVMSSCMAKHTAL